MKESLHTIIACPKCFGTLDYNKSQHQLICQHDQLVYVIRDGIPVLLENEAQALAQPASTTQFDNKDNV